MRRDSLLPPCSIQLEGLESSQLRFEVVYDCKRGYMGALEGPVGPGAPPLLREKSSVRLLDAWVVGNVHVLGVATARHAQIVCYNKDAQIVCYNKDAEVSPARLARGLYNERPHGDSKVRPYSVKARIGVDAQCTGWGALRSTSGLTITAHVQNVCYNRDKASRPAWPAR